MFFTGQARKSLWIETPCCGLWMLRNIGQARKSLWIETHSILLSEEEEQVRLVRACGSKHSVGRIPRQIRGQARKSLWIETVSGLKRQRAKTMVRLVRACGSKQCTVKNKLMKHYGQARKSLWIETYVKASWCATTVWSGS